MQEDEFSPPSRDRSYKSVAITVEVTIREHLSFVS